MRVETIFIVNDLRSYIMLFKQCCCRGQFCIVFIIITSSCSTMVKIIVIIIIIIIIIVIGSSVRSISKLYEFQIHLSLFYFPAIVFK